MVRRVSAGQPHPAHLRRRQRYPPLECGDRAGPSIRCFEKEGDPLAAYAGDRGADIFRACVACHTLGAEQANRAGPTLANLFGRRIATLPGYNFSDALKRLDIVWTPETVSRLFEIGPSAYTPGTKMPEQRIGSEDRAALVQFLDARQRDRCLVNGRDPFTPRRPHSSQISPANPYSSKFYAAVHANCAASVMIGRS